MISVAEAQETIEQKVGPLGSERMPLAQAQGRVLREPVASAEDIPAFDRSAMDGYAIRLDDEAKQFEVVGEIRAGQSVDLTLQPGQAIRILTGARLPASGLKVVMQEDVDVQGQRLLITKQSSATHIRKRGEDARAGEVLLDSGLVLDATALAVLASVGKAAPLVSRIPRVLHLTTGDEIVAPEETPAAGQIRNSNASLIAGLCREQGIEAITHRHVGDDPVAMTAELEKVEAKTFDLVLISGGSGGGTYDFSVELFARLDATIHFRQVNVRPGKPLIFGTNSSQVVFGLPGNALSHFVCFHLFVRRALERMAARSKSTTVRGILAESMSETLNARESWWPAKASLQEGRLECRALPWKSSGDITRLPAANALMKVPASTSHLDAGTMVELLFTRNPLS
jgi:molybdopterin molybdotransferase